MNHIKRIQHYLQATPIGDIGRLGDWSEPQSFNATDHRRVSRDSFLTKVKSSFERSPFDIDVFFVNKHGYDEKYLDYGVVSWDNLKHLMPEVYVELIKRPIDSSTAVTFLLTNNAGNDENNGLVYLTPWIIAHRLGHCIGIYRDNFNAERPWKTARSVFLRIVTEWFKLHYIQNHKEVHDLATSSVQILSPMFTFKTARESSAIDYNELFLDVFAHYVLNGTIKVQLPNYDLKIARPKPNFDPDQALRELRSVIADIEAGFKQTLHKAYGRVAID